MMLILYLKQDDVVYLAEPLKFTWATGLGERVRNPPVTVIVDFCFCGYQSPGGRHAVGSKLCPHLFCMSASLVMLRIVGIG